MIRINLLGTPKPKKGKRGGAAPVAIPSEGPSILIIVLIVFAIAGGINYGYYIWLNKTHDRLQNDLATADARIKTLSAVKAAYQEKQKQHDALKRRFDVIDQLRANQSGPVNLLNALSNTVNGTEAVWLNTMQDNGPTITLEGVALSTVSVANLMENLKKQGFKNVEIKETVQEDVVKDMQSFTFTMTCEKPKA